MTESNQVRTSRRVVETKTDSLTRWMLIGAGFMLLAVIGLVAYALASGVFTNTAPRTAAEYQLAATAEAIAKSPGSGTPYAQRAETLYKLGRVSDAFEVLDAGEAAVGEKTPDILFVLRARAMLLNQEERFADAEEVGNRAMDLNDAYVKQQIEANTAKGLVSGVGTVDQRAGVDIALQLAAALAAQEKWEEAVTAYSYALAWEPAAGDILTLRGWAYVSMSADASATLDFNEALRFLPNDPSALAGLAEIESK